MDYTVFCPLKSEKIQFSYGRIAKTTPNMGFLADATAVTCHSDIAKYTADSGGLTSIHSPLPRYVYLNLFSMRH